jgi:hypothetical protein
MTNARPRGGQRPLRLAAAALLLSGALLLQPHGAVADAATVRWFWGASAVMGAGFVLSWPLRSLPAWTFWAVAIGTRLLLLPMEPGDDIWRYLWEGRIQNAGFSPYHLPPADAALAALRTDWWPWINHPQVTAIYPPLCQLLFRLVAAISVSVAAFKLAFLAADLAICLLLCRCFGAARAALYAWNPLVIYSFSGGGHYDSWFLLPVVAAWLVAEGRLGAGWSVRGRAAAGALLLGVSVALKWVSLPLLAFPLRQALAAGRRRGALAITALTLLPLALGSLAYCRAGSCPLVPVGSAFVSHGRSAEAVPHLLARLWPATLASNAIHGVLLLVFVLVLTRRARTPGGFCLGYWLGLLLLSPIVHAWYFTWLMPFAVPSRHWGARLVSLSASVYFVLPSGDPDWALTDPQRLLLWLPLLLGSLASARRPADPPSDPPPERYPSADTDAARSDAQ